VNAHDAVTHEQAAELLHWLVNDSLEAEQKESILEHARACVICRREMDELEKLRDSIAHASMPVPAPDMRNINARIDASIDRQNRGRRLIEHALEAFGSPWRIAFVAQSVLLIILAGVLLWPAADDTEFTTLTDSNGLPAGHYVRVVFSPEIQTSEISSFLERFELEVVSGPSRRGVYTLGLDNKMTLQNRDSLVLFLQDDNRVLFAQPVAGGMEP